MAVEQGDVARSHPQRGEHERQDREAEVEILAEGAAVDQAAEVPVGGRDQADVDRTVLALAEPLDRPRLQHPQQLRLHRQRQLADFVEEDRPPGGGLE